MRPMTCGDATERGKGTQAYSGKTCDTPHDWDGGTSDDGRKEQGGTMEREEETR